MRKILLASAAAICAGGVASAEVSLSGEGKIGVEYKKSNAVGSKADTSAISSANVKFTLSGESDSLIGPYGASFTLDASEGVDGDTLKNPYVVHAGSAGGDLGKFSAGTDLSAADRLYGGTGDPGLNGLGVDDLSEGYDGDSGATIRWDKSIADFTLAFSTDLDDGWAVGATASLGDFTIGAGYDQALAGGENPLYLKDNVASFGVKTEISGITGNVYFSQKRFEEANKASESAVGVEAGFSMGDLAITVAYAKNDKHTDADGYGVGVSQDLGGGLSLKGGFANVFDVASSSEMTKFNAGLLMAF